MDHSLLPSVAKATLPVKYEAAKVALAECDRIDECKEWANTAAALASYAKQSDDMEMEHTAMRIRARALRRCGELLMDIEKNSGGRPSKTSAGTVSSFTRKDAAKKAGMYFRGDVRSYLEAMQTYDMDDIVAGCDPKDRAKLARDLNQMDKYNAQLKSKL